MKSPQRTRNPAPAPGNLIAGFGPKTSRALAAVGVHTLEALRDRDAYALYRELKHRDPSVSRNFLYAILAAQEGGDWRQIQRTRTTEILLRLDEMGLAPRRTPTSRKNYN